MSTPLRRLSFVHAALIGAFAAIAACGRPKDTFEARLALARTATTATAELLDAEPAKGDGFTVSAHWRVRARSDWQTYASALEGRLIGFEKTAAPDGALRFIQTTAGDVYNLELVRVEAGPPLVVAVTLIGRPD